MSLTTAFDSRLIYGQYSYVADFGLLFYNARWYDPALGRFAQADSIVPNLWNPGDFDRYAYVRNSPVTYLDPTGHYREESEGYKKVITFRIGLDVNLASSGIGHDFNEDGIAAQYIYNSEGGLPPIGHPNLCGDIALSMIFETVTGKRDTLDEIYRGSPNTRAENGATFCYDFSFR